MKTCKNCKTQYTSKFNYCPNCGAKWLEYRLTPRKITAEFTERYLGTENVFIKTCITLFRYPEDVINGYVTGQRKKYVNVINFFFISLSLFGFHIFILKTFFPELLGLDSVTVNNGDSGEYLSTFFDYMGLFTTVFLPFYAMAGWFAFYKKRYNYVEHLVLFGYVFGIINIMSFLSTPILIIGSFNYFDISSISSVLTIILIAWYYKRIFELSFWNSVVKTILLTFIYFIIQLVIMIVIGIIIFAFIAWLSPETLEGFNINIDGKEL